MEGSKQLARALPKKVKAMEEEEDVDPLYKRSFSFAKARGYGAVQFIDETADKRPLRRRPSSMYKQPKAFPVPQDDRRNPVHVKKSAPRGLEPTRSKCFDKSVHEKDEELDTMLIIESVKKDIAMVKKMSNDFEKFTDKSPGVKQRSAGSGTRSKSKNKRRYRRRFKGASTSKSPTADEAEDKNVEESVEKAENQETEEDVIMSAPLDKYMEYLSQRCSSVCNSVPQKSETSKTMTETSGAESTSVLSQDTAKRPSLTMDEAALCRLKSLEVRASVSKPGHSRPDARAKSPQRVRKLRRKAHRPRNISRNNTPNTDDILPSVTEAKQEQDQSSPEEGSRLPRLKDKTSLQYKLCNSISSTIFRETQLAQKNEKDMSVKLPVVEIDVICMTDDRDENDNENDEMPSACAPTKRRENHKPRRLEPIHGATEGRSVARRRCVRKERPSFHQTQLPRAEVKDIANYRRDGDKAGSCPNLLSQGKSACKSMIKKVVSKSPTLSCRSNVSSLVGDSPTKFDIVGHSPCDIPSPARGDGTLSEATGVCGNLKSSHEGIKELSPPNESANNPATLDLPENPRHEEDGREVFQKIFSCPRQEADSDETYSLSTSKSPQLYFSLRNGAPTGDGEKLNKLPSETKTYMRKKDNNDLYGECSRSLLEDLEVESLSCKNANNNALPQMPMSPDKTRTNIGQKEQSLSPLRKQKEPVCSSRPYINEEHPSRLPVLPRNSNASPMSTRRMKSQCLEISRTAIPPVNSEIVSRPKHGQRSVPQGVNFKGAPKEMQSAKLPELPHATEYTCRSLNKAKWNTTGHVSGKNGKSDPVRLSPVSSKDHQLTTKIAVRFGHQGGDGDTQSVMKDVGRTHPLNKSYVISRSAPNHDSADNSRAICGLLPVLTSSVSRTRLGDEKPCQRSDKNNMVKGTDHPLEASSLKLKSEPLVMSSTMPNLSLEHQFFPKPTASSKSPSLATPRVVREDVRQPIGKKTEQSFSDSMSLNKTQQMCENANNNAHDDEMKHSIPINEYCTAYFDPDKQKHIDYSLSSESGFAYLGDNGESYRAVRCLREISPSSLQMQSAYSDKNANNCHCNCVSVHASDSDSVCSSELVRSELEHELSILMEDSTRRANSVTHFNCCSPFYSSRMRCVHGSDSLSDINASNTTGRNRPVNEERGRSIYRSHAREREHARRRCIHLPGERQVIPDNGDTLSGQNTHVENQYRQVRLVQPGMELQPLPRHSIAPTRTNGSQEVTNHRPQASLHWSSGIAPCSYTTENYWQTAAQGPLPSLAQYRNQHNDGVPHSQNSQAHASYFPTGYKPENVPRFCSINVTHPTLDDPMDNDSDNDSNDSVRSQKSPDNLTQRPNIGDVYKRLDEMMLQSQHELSHQLETMNETMHNRLQSLQNLVEKRFQRTCSLIQNNYKNKKEEKTKRVVAGAEKRGTNVDTIQLTTAKAEQSTPAYGFPLIVSKYTRESKVLTDANQSTENGNKKVKEGSSDGSTKTFPTIQFKEVTQNSIGTLPSQSHCQINASDSSQNMYKSTESMFTPQQENSSCHLTHEESVTISTSKRPARPQLRSEVSKKKSSKVGDVKRFRTETPSPRYKSMKQWRDEVSCSFACNRRCHSKNDNSHYSRTRHSRSCRRRQAAEGISCNKCLPLVFASDETTVCARPRNCKFKKITRRQTMRGILRNSRRQTSRKPRKKLNNKSVRFKLQPRICRRRRHRKLRSPPPRYSVPSSGNSRSKATSRKRNKCSHNCLHWQRKITQSVSPMMSQQAGCVRNRCVVLSRKPKHPTRKKTYIIGPKGHKTLYKLFRRRYEVLRRRLSKLRCDQMVNSPMYSTRQIDQLVNRFRRLISLFPERRLRTLYEILDPCRHCRFFKNRAALKVTKSSPAKPQVLSGEVSKKTKKSTPTPIQRRQVEPLTQSNNFNSEVSSMPTQPRGALSLQHEQEMPTYNVDNLQFRNFTNSGATSTGNTSYVNRMLQRPGYYFFNTTTPTTNHSANIGVSPSDSSSSHSIHPRPVDSLNLIRRQLCKSRNTSRNACTARKCQEDSSDFTKFANDDGRKVLFVGRDFPDYTEGMMSIGDTIEGGSTLVNWSSSNGQLGIIPMPQIVLVRTSSFSSRASDIDMGLTSEDSQVKYRSPGQEIMSNATQHNTNDAECMYEQRERSTYPACRPSAQGPLQRVDENIVIPVQTFFIDTYEPGIVIRNHVISTNQANHINVSVCEAEKSNSDEQTSVFGTDGLQTYRQMSVQSHTTGTFDVDRLTTDQETEQSVIHGNTGSSTQETFHEHDVRSQDPHSEPTVAVLQETSVVLTVASTGSGTNDQTEFKPARSLQTQRKMTEPPGNDARYRPPFKSFLWQGFKATDNSCSRYKTSHLLSFQTDTYRSPPNNVASSSTCSTRRSGAEFSVVDVCMKTHDKSSDNEQRGSTDKSTGSDLSHCQSHAVNISENSIPFRTNTKMLHPKENPKGERPKGGFGVEDKKEPTINRSEWTFDEIQESANLINRQIIHSESASDSNQKNGLPTLVLRYRPRNLEGPSDRTEETDRTGNASHTPRPPYRNIVESNADTTKSCNVRPPKENASKDLPDICGLMSTGCPHSIPSGNPHLEYFQRSASASIDCGTAQKPSSVQKATSSDPSPGTITLAHDRRDSLGKLAENGTATHCAIDAWRFSLTNSVPADTLLQADINANVIVQPYADTNSHRGDSGKTNNGENTERPLPAQEGNDNAILGSSKEGHCMKDQRVPVCHNTVPPVPSLANLEEEHENIPASVPARCSRCSIQDATAFSSPRNESNNDSTHAIQQPWFIVNSPGISTTWVYYVPEPSASPAVDTNNVSSPQDTEAMEHDESNHRFINDYMRDSMWEEDVASENNCNQSNAIGTQPRVSINRRQAVAKCRRPCDNNRTDQAWALPAEFSDSLTKRSNFVRSTGNENDLICTSDTTNNNGITEDMAPNSELSSSLESNVSHMGVASTTAENTGNRNHQYTQSPRSESDEPPNYHSKTDNKTRTSNENKISVDLEAMSGHQTFLPNYGQRIAGFHAACKIEGHFSDNEPSPSQTTSKFLVKQTCSPNPPSSTPSREHNNNAIRPIYVCDHLCHQSPITSDPPCAAHISLDICEDLDEHIDHENSNSGVQLTRKSCQSHELYQEKQTFCSEWKNQHSPLMQPSQNEQSRAIPSKANRGPVFNTSTTRSLKTAGQKRRAGKYLFQQMSPPMKVSKRGSHSFLSQFLNTRQERIAVRRTRRQLTRELTQLRYRQARKERGGVPGEQVPSVLFERDGLRRRMASYASGSDADSESSL